MQDSVETKGPLERSITVEVPEERVSSAVEERLESMTRTSRIQGFRPGKAPLRVVRQRFGPQVRQEVVEKLINTSLMDALKQQDLKPVGTPLLNPLRTETGAGISYTATFEVLPEVSLKPVEELQIEKPSCHIEEVDVDNMIARLRHERREFQVVQRAAGQGDLVNADYQGMLEGKPLENLKMESSNVEIGGDEFIPGLEPVLKGAHAGQSLEFDAPCPDDFANKELAGKTVRFQVRVNRVEEAVLPELDAEFFRAFGVQDGGEQAFRQEIRNHLERQVEAALRNRYRDSIMSALYEANKIDVPQALVNMESERMQELLIRDMTRRGMDREVAELLINPEELKNTARRQAALQLLTAELIRTRELHAKPEKVREIIESQAQSYEDSAAFINWHYSDEKRLAAVESVALEDEVINCIAALGKITEKSLSFDELMNKGQTDGNG